MKNEVKTMAEILDEPEGVTVWYGITCLCQKPLWRSSRLFSSTFIAKFAKGISKQSPSQNPVGKQRKTYWVRSRKQLTADYSFTIMESTIYSFHLPRITKMGMKFRVQINYVWKPAHGTNQTGYCIILWKETKYHEHFCHSSRVSSFR